MEFKVIAKLPQANIKSSADQTESIMVTVNNRNEVLLKNQPKSFEI
jgi:biopolymer transport protein ExbD